MMNKHYPAQFKADAVALFRSRPGATIAQIADDLGVNRETLRSWVRADDQRRGAGGPAASSADNAAAESFNATFKRETLQGGRAFADEREAGLASFRCCTATTRSAAIPGSDNDPRSPTRTSEPHRLRWPA